MPGEADSTIGRRAWRKQHPGGRGKAVGGKGGHSQAPGGDDHREVDHREAGVTVGLHYKEGGGGGGGEGGSHVQKLADGHNPCHATGKQSTSAPSIAAFWTFVVHVNNDNRQVWIWLL